MKAYDVTSCPAGAEQDQDLVHTLRYPEATWYRIYLYHGSRNAETGRWEAGEWCRTVLVDEEARLGFTWYQGMFVFALRDGQMDMKIGASLDQEERARWEARLKPGQIFYGRLLKSGKNKGKVRYQPVDFDSLGLESLPPPTPEEVQQARQEMARREIAKATEEVQKRWAVGQEVK